MGMNVGMEDLVVAAQLGDAGAFGELVERCHHTVHGLILSDLGDWSTAEDITQDVFLNVWVHLRELKDPRSFTMWVRRIARNCAVDWLRYRGMQKRRSAPVADGQDPELDYDDPATLAARRECLDQICEALQSVSPKIREALILHYLEGHSVAEAAEALGIRTETMKKRLQLGRALLQRDRERRELREREPFGPYSPRPSSQRVVAALAAGPFVPLSHKVMTASKTSLTFSHLGHGGSIQALKSAGLSGHFLNWVAAGTLALASVLGGGSLILAHATQDNAGKAASNGAGSGQYYEGTGHLHSEVWDDPKLGSYLLLDEVFPGGPCDQAGLRAGDRIVAVNGKPLNHDLWNSGVQRLKGPAGTSIQVTVKRPRPDGTEEEFDTSITRNLVSREMFDLEQAKWKARKESEKQSQQAP